MVSHQDMNKHREPECTGITQDKKYFEIGSSFVKRTLRRHEWIENTIGWKPPANLPQRWTTDGAVLQYLQEHAPSIPVPRFRHTMEDDGAFYFCTEFVPGISMVHFTPEQKDVVTKELMVHLATLKSLRSDTPGVPGQTLLCPPLRMHRDFWKSHTCWRPKADLPKGDYVFCHNDLSQYNVLVDPETLKINAIVDWEYAGFWPEWFERPYWTREGPGAPLEGELDDIDQGREWLREHCDEVEMPHLLTLLEKMDRAKEES
ncbi:uncharacterized protein SPSK_01927 [Sporothrix schenckii 1099-18]|uniref:Aminoglycoside phosphotransferase domain-containing protein n=1 Tax=Sporothrix schenckii 1099-18 TaxID=1397361 RepID=A0A0F2MC95_SPOSC|nr:uncharacterized protein SPSK_01927 [Sporothrix schenckii 1099-18]KJR87267.1 hypothetical protein SPSK_01927 [Sporothrix schenckii 1099-18]